MRPILASALLIAASHGHFHGPAFDAMRLGRRQDPSTAADFQFRLDQVPRAEKRADENIMKIKKIPDEDLKKAAQIAKEALQNADKLERYRDAVNELSGVVAKATECYDTYAKKGNEVSNPDAVADCHKQYEQARSALGKARSIAGEADFLSDSWLFRENLPNVNDGRPTQAGAPTKQLQDILANLKAITAKAEQIRSQATQLQPYHAQVQELNKQISKTQECYDSFSAKIQKDGFESVADVSRDLNPCHELFTKVQATLGEAQKISKEPRFPIGDVLSKFELPDLRDGLESNKDAKTQAFWKDLEKLQKSRDSASNTAAEDSAQVDKVKAEITDEIKKMVKRAVDEEWPRFLKFVALSEAKTGATDDSVLEATKTHGNKFIQDLQRQSDKIAEDAVKGLPRA